MSSAISIQQMHIEAKRRHKSDSAKCYQRHIRELYGEHERREKILTLDGAVVEQISYAEAEAFIVKYEWLGKMAALTKACYGLRIAGELIGVECFAAMGGSVSNICGPEHKHKAVCLARGACVPHAPKKAPSFLIRQACLQAYQNFGWKIFFAYSDAEAGEMGIIYQRCHWKYLGAGVGRNGEKSFHVDWRSPDGTKTITSNKLNHDTEKKFFRSLGWSELKGEPRAYLQYALGWTPVIRYGKKKYVWFEGTAEEWAELKARCRYPFLPYPKRVTKDRRAEPRTISQK